MRLTLIGFFTAISAIVSGCEGGDGGVCMPVASLTTTLKEPNTAVGWSSKLDSCLGRWGYSLAASKGSIDDLAHATLGGCQDALTTMVSTQLNEARGQQLSTEPYDQALADARRAALEKAAFYVAVGRAGHCKRPL